jgi:Cd2+/Zn2+-exporting ATPase
MYQIKMERVKKINFDRFLLIALAIVLSLHYAKLASPRIDDFFLTFFASIATLPVLFSAFRSLKNKKISVDLLASIALIVSLLNKEWASAVFINLMLTSARIFAAYTENRSKKAIKSLLKLRPEKVKVKRGKEIIEESVSKIKKDDLIVIELGDRVPVDGIIVEGQASIDQSSLTGESMPIDRKVGEEVFSSTLNVSGSLVIRAEKIGKDTTFEKIVKLVEQSQNDKAGIKTVADKFTSWYIVVTIIGTIIMYIFSHNLSLILAVLLVTCADDIAVAIPMAFSAAIGSAAKRGIIIKGGEYLEGLTKVKTLLMDKTGTITKGKLRIEKVMALGDFSEKDVLKLAAIADCFSEHPVAKAIIRYAEKHKIKFENPTQFKEFSGKGSTAQYRGNEIVCGRKVFLKEIGVAITKEQEDIIKAAEKNAGAILLVGYGKDLIGYIELADEVRSDSKEAISALRALGIKNFVMLTGDNEITAKKVADEVGIDIFHANLLPQDKIKYVKKYINNESKVAMIGDGVNDAASLALSDVGIAMGVIGSDTAIEAADIALMKDDISKVPEVVGLGKLVAKISRQDFLIWGIINAVGLLLVFRRYIGPEGAAAFNFVTDFFPIVNSLRLFGYKFPKDKQRGNEI